MKNLVIRALTGIVYIALIVGGILGGPQTYTLLFAVVTAATLWEFASNVNHHTGASVNRLINTMAGVFLFVAMAGFCSDFVAPKAFIPISYP